MKKKLSTLSAICIIASIFFSSCKSNMSIIKRHYNNGYYIAHSKGSQTVFATREGEKIAQTKVRKTLYSVQNKDEQNTRIKYSDNSPITDNSTIVVTNEKTHHKIISKQRTKKVLVQKNKIIGNTGKQIVQNCFSIKKISDDSDKRDGLSLFWIIILVVLVLWAVGFLAGGFGLGGFINVLLIIALVLLILWLLRIL